MNGFLLLLPTDTGVEEITIWIPSFTKTGVYAPAFMLIRVCVLKRSNTVPPVSNFQDSG